MRVRHMRHYVHENDQPTYEEQSMQSRIPLYSLAALVILGMLIGRAAHAQSEPMTFAASVTEADEVLTTTLTWEAPGASSCVADGHPAWTGEKPAAGVLELPSITLSGTYSLTLTCTWPADSQAKLTWTNPATNTDGTPFANPKAIRVVWGLAPDQLSSVIDLPLVAGALASSHTLTGLTPGTWYFAVRAVNSLDRESDLSNIASKVITGEQSRERSLSLTVNPVPSAATGLEAT